MSPTSSRCPVGRYLICTINRFRGAGNLETQTDPCLSRHLTGARKVTPNQGFNRTAEQRRCSAVPVTLRAPAAG
jgi:hypothetical protein